jgi:ferredoxin
MALKSYSFKTRREALDLERTVKKLFKKKTPTMADFRDKICVICPHKCTTCAFCWNMFYKFRNAKVDYNAPLAVLKVLISGYYDSIYIPTFYFLKTNICNICGKYDQACHSVSIGDACPSRYLIQMESNECARQGISNDENMYNGLDTGEFNEYDYINGRTYSSGCYNQKSFARNTKPKLSIDGEKMQKLVNKLFGISENEHA